MRSICTLVTTLLLSLLVMGSANAATSTSKITAESLNEGIASARDNNQLIAKNFATVYAGHDIAESSSVNTLSSLIG